MLERGASAVDVVTEVVGLLEECHLFNAGVGAVLNRVGEPELEAAVMDGHNRRCGAVSCVQRTLSPVRLARAVMEAGEHVMLAGSGADAFAAQAGLAQVEPTYFVTSKRQHELAETLREGTIRGSDTVGAVARDAEGHLASATSTGGLNGKHPGRMGDTALIGCGIFADDGSLAIACSGTGESFIRSVFAMQVHARVQFSRWTLQRACGEALERVVAYGGDGGCVAVDATGELALPFNSPGMFRAWRGADARIRVAVDEREPPH